MSNEPLKAVSNVIELKSGRKYLLLFKGATPEAVRGLCDALREQGISGVVIDVGAEQDIQVIEVPVEEQS